MSDNQPVAYPSLGAAYPVNNSAYPVAPPVPAFKPAEVFTPTEVSEPTEAFEPTEAYEQVEQATEVSAPKFFPLVPTPTSKFVAQDDAVVVESEIEQEVEPEPEAVVAVENLFDISPSLTHEPQTNSIVLDTIPDVLTSSEVFTDAGEILVTGSIELPTLTGEVALVNESPEADSADAMDSASVMISTVAPVRAPSVINSKAQLGVLPSKRRRSQGQLMAMLTLGLLIITVGTLYVMASILGIIE